MTIELVDIPTAVADYLDNHVTIVVGEMSSGGTIQRDEIGEFSVTVTNAPEPDGVRLINVRYHLTMTPLGRAQFQADSSALTPQRESINPNSPVLSNGELVDEIVLFPLPGFNLGELDVGEVAVINGLNVKGTSVGAVTIKCHVHAEIDQDSLFPTGERTPNGESRFSVT